MSSVDNRIVKMGFDNERFERNAKQTMSTLDKLKSLLRFKDEEKELKDFENAANSFSLAHMESALDTIADKFTTMGNVGLTVLQNLTNKAVDAGMSLVKSLTIDNISAGWGKYEEETNAVASIYAAVKRKGKSLDDVYDTLDKLTSYSDETSYSYTQMASALSTFVSSGQDINKSEKAIEGIANAAAKAGVGVDRAQVAFRNFADAMSKGKFLKEDWRSIQNINMDTEDFRETVIKTAIDLGKLDKEGKVVTSNSTKRGKKVKKEQVTIQNFAEMLKHGFFDSEVMLAVLDKYADRTTEYGQEAFEAAQKARSFKDVVDAVKDSVATGWKTSFRYIFGDLEEATDLFSSIADEVIVFLQNISELRNAILEGWKNLGGRDSMIQALHDIWSTFKTLTFGDTKSAIRQAFISVFNAMEETADGYKYEGGFAEGWSEKLADITQKISEGAEALRKWVSAPKRLMNITKIFRGLFSIISLVGKGVEFVWELGKKIFKQLQPIIDPLLEIFAEIGQHLFEFNKELQRTKAISNFAARIAKWFEPITSRLPKVIEDIRSLFKNVWTFLTTNPYVVNFTKSVKKMFNAFVDFVPKAIDSVIEWGKKIIKMVEDSDEFKKLKENYDKYVVPLAQELSEGATKFNNALAGFFNTDTSDEETYWGKIKKRFGAFDEFGKWVTDEWEKLKERYPLVKQFDEWLNGNPLVKKIGEFFGKLWESFDAFMSLDTSSNTSLIGKIKERFAAFWAILGPYLTQQWDAAKLKYPFLQKMEDFFRMIFGKETEAKADEAAQQGEELTKKLNPVFESLQQFGAKIQEWAAGKDAGDFIKIAGLIVGIVEAFRIIKKFDDWLSIGTKIKQAVKEVGWILDGVYEQIRAGTLLTKATALLELAGSIWLIADSFMKLSTLSWEQVGAGLAALGGIFLETGGFIAIMSAIEKHGTPIVNLKASMMIGIGANMELMADSLKKLSEIADWTKIGQALLAMGGIFLEEAGFMAVLGFAKKYGISANAVSLTTLIGIGANMEIMADSLKKLSEVGDWKKIEVGLASMGLIFAEEAGFMIVVGAANKIGMIGGLSLRILIGIAENMKSLGDTLMKLSGLSLDKAKVGLETMGLIFAEEAGFMIVVGVAQKLTKAVSFMSLIGIAINMQILAGVVEKFGKMKLEEAKQGLGVLAVMFAEEAAFMTIVSIAQSFGSPVSFANIIATAGSAYVLGEEIQKLGVMPWDQIGKGLAAMAGIFAITGSYTTLMNALNKGVVPNQNATNLATGVMMLGVGSLGDALLKLGTMNWDQIGQGLAAMAGIFVEGGIFATVMGHLKTIKFGQAIAFTLVAASMWLLANAMKPIAELNQDQIDAGLKAMGLIAGGLGVLVAAMGEIKPKNGAMKTFLNTLAVGISVAAMMYVFALSVKEVKDIDPAVVLNFATAIDMVAGAMAVMAGVVTALGNLGVGKALAGEAAVAGLGAVIALIADLFGKVMAGLSDNMAVIGANLAQFQDQTKDLDAEKIGGVIGIIQSLADAFVDVGLKDYGNIETFRTELQKIGSNIKLFSINIKDIVPTKLTKVSNALRTVSGDLSAFPIIGDIAPSIANLGAAMKIYGESLSGVSLEGTPNSESIKAVIQALVDVAPSDSQLKSIASYGTTDRGKELTSFALGLTNLGTAVSSFSTNVEGMKFEKMDNAIAALDSIAALSNRLGMTAESKIDLGPIGTFSTELSTRSGDLGTFATDIVSLGSALESFGTNMSKVDIEKVDAGTLSLGKIVDINTALPKEGGISQWLTGTQSLTRFSANLRLLGSGALAFSDSVKGGQFDAASVSAAGDALIKIAEINAKLPATGGISQWFTGEQDLGHFGSNLGKLGDGVSEFAKGFGDTVIGQNVIDSLPILSAIADLSIKMTSGSGSGWADLTTLSTELVNTGKNIKTFNEDMSKIKWSSNYVGAKSILNWAVDEQIKLGHDRYNATFKQLGTDLKGFYTEVDSVNGLFSGNRLQNVSNSIVEVLNTINSTTDKLGSEDFSMVDGITKFLTGGAIAMDAYNEVFEKKGKDIADYVSNGLKDSTSETKIKNAMGSVLSRSVSVVKNYKNNFKIAAEYIPAGIADGIYGNSATAVNAVKNLASALLITFNRRLGVESPSKEFAKSGMYSVLGFAHGISDYSAVADDSAKEMADNAIRSVLDEMKHIADLPLSEMDLQPTIRPVLDLSNIHAGAQVLGSIFDNRTIGFNARAIESRIPTVVNPVGGGFDINSIAQNVSDIHQQLDTLNERITNLQVVMDSKALVGSLESEIDRRLGARARMRERGN